MNRDISRDEDIVIDTPPTRRPTRRAILLGVGGVGTAAAIAACGPMSSDSSTSGAGTDGGPAASGPLGAASSIPVGGGKIFPDRLVVVTQPSAGAFKAFTATCTHEGCTLNQIANGLIMCPCHGSEYSITDGSVKQGPALRPLAEKEITVANGEITLG